MNLEINGRTYNLYFGLDFLDYIEKKHSPTMEVEGQRMVSGFGGLAMLETKMNQYSEPALADVLIGGTASERNKLTRKQVEAHFNNLSDDEYFELYDDVIDELGKSSTLRRAEKAQKRLNKKNNQTEQ